jgi:hypothetical protein
LNGATTDGHSNASRAEESRPGLFHKIMEEHVALDGKRRSFLSVLSNERFPVSLILRKYNSQTA